MNPLLRLSQSLCLGASVNGMYTSGYLHADDIRTLAANITTLETQISMVNKFTEDNFLQLNASKCEIVIFKTSTAKVQEACVNAGENSSYPVNSEAKCLGYVWKQNLSSTPMINYFVSTIQKAIKESFFQFGSAFAFQGKLSLGFCRLC